MMSKMALPCFCSILQGRVMKSQDMIYGLRASSRYHNINTLMTENVIKLWANTPQHMDWSLSVWLQFRRQ